MFFSFKCTELFFCNNKENVLDNSFNSFPTDSTNLLWHYGLGHVPFVKMKGISFIPVNFSPKQPFFCPICPMAKQSRLPFPPKSNSSTNIFELLHVDLWGPYQTPTHDNFKYFITLVDDFSKSTWTHLLSSKSNSLHIFKAFILMVENQFKTTIKTIRSDNGLEFTNNESIMFFQNKGIIKNLVHIHPNKME